VDTTATREMSADVILENMQTVVFGGLTETLTSEKESGIPILKDIPWIGKWLFGSVEYDEQRSELLVFMTPYVLDDADAAQAEALRRKKTMSDPTPWEDGGWSASELADPVSQKEIMRRLTDEWKKQDAERKSKLAIEQAKIERVKQLKALSEEERKVWLKMHKEELEKEAREELEEKMLDEKSQEELKKIAESARKRKLEEANREIEASKQSLKDPSESSSENLKK
jgi:type II secretory pathway component HofQ